MDTILKQRQGVVQFTTGLCECNQMGIDPHSTYRSLRSYFRTGEQKKKESRAKTSTSAQSHEIQIDGSRTGHKIQIDATT
jgi:hypothetical protein